MDELQAQIEDIKKQLQSLEDGFHLHGHRGWDATQKLSSTEISRANLIDDLTLGDGVNKSGRMALKLAPTKGDTFIKGGTITDGDFDNSDGNSGFIMGLDDSDSDLPKFFFGNATENLEYDGTNLKSDNIILSSAKTFGGDGSDGALSIASGTTTIDLSSAALVTKNYTSISITGTGKLAFSNPHANGTIIVLKSQGAVTVTSSTSPAIDASAMGADGGTAGASSGGNGGTGAMINYHVNGATSVGGGGSTGSSTTSTNGGATNTSLTTPYFYLSDTNSFVMRHTTVPILIAVGSGGGGSGGSAGNAGVAGGKGGGAVYIECSGALNFTSTVSVAGGDGVTGLNAGDGASGGSGGGAGGSFVVLYNTLTANSGTVTYTGGTGGSGKGAGAANLGATGGGTGGGQVTYKGGKGGEGSNSAGGTVSGGAGGNDADGTDGSNASGGSPAGSGSGGGGASGYKFIAKNIWIP